MSSLLLHRREVVAPDIERWTVGVCWLPRVHTGSIDLTSGRRPNDDRLWQLVDHSPSSRELDEANAIVALLEAVLAVLIFIVNMVAATVAVVVLLVARVVFHRPWVVQARGETSTLEWEVVGQRATQHLIDTVATRLGRGEPLDDVRAS